MNSINFNQTGGLPITLDDFDFMQNSYVDALKGLAGIVGTYAIVGGCEYDSVSKLYGNGYVVINGEVLPFLGGVGKAYIVVLETKSQVSTQSGSSKDFKTTRVASFSDEGTVKWSDFVDHKDILGRINTSSFHGYKNLLINGRFNTYDDNNYDGGVDGKWYITDMWKFLSNEKVAISSISIVASPLYYGKMLTLGSVPVVQIVEGEAIGSGNYCVQWFGTATLKVYRAHVTNLTTQTSLTPVSIGTFTDIYGRPCNYAVYNLSYKPSLGLFVEFSGAGGTVSDVQLEMGSFPTAFEILPRSIEEQRCRAFYRVITYSLTSITIGHNLSLYHEHVAFIPIYMRAFPTIRGTGSYSTSNASNSTRFVATKESLEISLYREDHESQFLKGTWYCYLDARF